jgi:hypothetical protein
VANSRWSKGISLAAQNSSGRTFVTDNEVKGRPTKGFVLGLRIYAAQDKFWRTKCVEFTHHYIIVNQYTDTLLINQVGTVAHPTHQEYRTTANSLYDWFFVLRVGPATSEVYSVLPGESLPFIWSDYRMAEKFPLVASTPRPTALQRAGSCLWR